MIPEISKLNWSSEKPSFEEVKGKCVFVINKKFINDSIMDFIPDETQFCGMFDGFDRYAIIDMTAPEPEIKPYHQLLPEIARTFGIGWEYKYRSEFERYYVCGFASRLHAVNAWNDFVNKLEGI